LVAPTRARTVRRALLTIDLTEAVLAEALELKAGLIVAYHPPLFAPLKRVDGAGADPKQRILAAVLENKLAVYSPHTALDAAPGGINDWLCAGLGAGDTRPLEQEADDARELKVAVFTPAEAVDQIRTAMADAGAGIIGDYAQCSFGSPGEGTFLGGASTNPAVGRAGRLENAPEIRLEMVCPTHALPRVAAAIAKHHPYEEPAWDAYPLAPRPRLGAGAGRLLTLAKPTPLKTLLARAKKMLGLKQVRLAAPTAIANPAIRTVAVCPGAGGSLFERVTADLYLTGEMRHHDVLAKTEAGASVILTDHTNTERPYLPTLAQRLNKALAGKVEVVVSKTDADPLNMV
ncbi:MAG: Nif3-like dinuclear metal center hexameric protein, partial [Planctomycetota bacterium]